MHIKGVGRAVTYPALTVLVERFDDTIRFDPAVAQSGIEKDER